MSQPYIPPVFAPVLGILAIVWLFVMVAVVSYAIGYAWTMFDSWRRSRWRVVATGPFDSITDGVRQRVRLADGRTFLLALAHRELDLLPGEHIRVLVDHGGRHRVERVA